MTQEAERSTIQRAEDAAASGCPELAQALALIAIAKDLASVRSELRWQRQHAGKLDRRG